MTSIALNRVVVAQLTNKSGGDLSQGAVVIWSTGTASAFTTTTTAGDQTEPVGVIVEPNGIANNATGAVAFQGYVPKINLSGSASLGDFVKTHTVAGQGVRHGTPSVAGDFAVVLATGTSPAAWLFGTNFAAGGGGGASTGDSFVTISHDADLSAERTLKAGAGLGLTDGGANGDVTLAMSVIGARAYHNADQTLTNNTAIALALNSERYDTDTIHDTVTNNSRLTCHTAGKYDIKGNGRIAANATGDRYLSIRLNGTTTIAITYMKSPGASILILSVACDYQLAVNDYVELVAFQNSGGDINLEAIGNYSPEFSMHLIG